MGVILWTLVVAVAGIVAGVRWVAPWARRRWPAWLVKAVFGSVLVLACWGAPTEPLVAQSPSVVAHEASDTTAGLRVQWDRPAGDSVQAKTAGCYRVKVNGQAWGRWSCRYLTEAKMAVAGHEPPPPPPVDSQPVPPDTVPTPPDTTPPPPPPPPPTGGALSANSFRSAGDPGTGLPWLWRGGQVVADAKMGTALQFTYPAGKTGGTAPGNVWVDEGVLKATQLPSVTFDGWLWVSANWQGHLTTTNKALFIGFGQNGNQLFLNLRGKGSAALVPSLGFNAIPKLPIPGAVCANGGCAGSVGSGTFSRATWHHVVIAASRTDVTLDIDGRRAATVTGLDWGSQGPFYVAKVAINPTWGGGGDVVASTMQLRWAGVTLTP